jgi:hypothetical protein
MPTRREDPPVTSYEDYLRRYLPDDAEEQEYPADADPEEISEERGRRAVERAVAQLTSEEDPGHGQ